MTRPRQPEAAKPTKHRTRFRQGDLLVTVVTTIQSAIVDYADIFDACTFDPDTGMPPPWEDRDGWEHECSPVHHSREANNEARQGYFRDGRDGDWVITITDDTVRRVWGVDAPPGSSKQQRYEAVARAKRKAIAQLVKWRTDGWCCTVVDCSYLGEEEGICGVYADDYSDPYLQDTAHTVTVDVADKLEKKGFTVVNRPDVPSAQVVRRRNACYSRARNFGFETWLAYLKWLSPSRWQQLEARISTSPPPDATTRPLHLR